MLKELICIVNFQAFINSWVAILGLTIKLILHIIKDGLFSRCEHKWPLTQSWYCCTRCLNWTSQLVSDLRVGGANCRQLVGRRALAMHRAISSSSPEIATSPRMACFSKRSDQPITFTRRLMCLNSCQRTQTDEGNKSLYIRTGE